MTTMGYGLSGLLAFSGSSTAGELCGMTAADNQMRISLAIVRAWRTLPDFGGPLVPRCKTQTDLRRKRKSQSGLLARTVPSAPLPRPYALPGKTIGKRRGPGAH